MDKKKIVTTATVVATTAAVLLTGTYAWQSANQEAMNVASGTVNPGGRLHDDFNGEDKKIYVENFGNQNIYARIKLSEYFEIGVSAGKEFDNTDRNVTKITGEDSYYSDTQTWPVHKYESDNITDDYWDWEYGQSAISYMPTFNLNKDSLEADINGTYYYDDGLEETEDDRYKDYVDYSLPENSTKTDNEIYDADTDTIDQYKDGTGVENVNYSIIADQTHTVATTLPSCIKSMSDWNSMTEDEQNATTCWIYDEDGWAYWSKAIEPGTATGPLLKSIAVKNVDDSWFYAINAVAQFVTADDLGQSDNTGFYDNTKGSAPSENALELLRFIGVNTGNESAEEPEAGLSDEAIALAKEIYAKNVEESIFIEDVLPEDASYTSGYHYYLLAKEDNKALLMLFSGSGGGGNGIGLAFDSTTNSWENSSLRAYLNNAETGFLSDKSVLNELIMETTIYTSDPSDLDNYITTTDRVFILSEADRLGTKQGVAVSYDEDPYAFTIAPGDDGNIIPDELRLTGSGIYYEEDIMWTRTPGSNGSVRSATTRTSGTDGESTPSTLGTVLPLFWVDLSSAIESGE